ncbi:MAG: hypothetical protein EON59_09595 [Alphaproteobacteria bacterium]|nr:MAG: hypothetical protein EON59_09595 [Alphaproteobacteria bacterium]
MFRPTRPPLNGFASAIDDVAKERGWRKAKTENPFLLEYDLPAEIAIAGDYRTRRIAFTASGIMAVLELADPAVAARREGIENAMDPTPLLNAVAASGKVPRAEVEAQVKFRKFLGERVVSEIREPASEPGGYGTHAIVSRSISNVTTHAGKTLYGCSYSMELLDDAGKPL